VANFLQYVDEGFYEGVLFHRVVTDFVIQAGGFVPGADGMERKDATRPPVAGEAPNGLSNVRGTVAMALRGEDADSGDTQFFVNLIDNALLDEGPPPFTVFAEVVEGMDVVDAIAATPKSGETPTDDVIIREIARVSGVEGAEGA
jgi:peptidyl-prolyl cis-trans isomerase A (cyclophilin A)